MWLLFYMVHDFPFQISIQMLALSRLSEIQEEREEKLKVLKQLELVQVNIYFGQ